VQAEPAKPQVFASSPGSQVPSAAQQPVQFEAMHGSAR